MTIRQYWEIVRAQSQGSLAVNTYCRHCFNIEIVFSNNIFLSVHILLCCLRPFHHVRLWRCDCKIYIKHCQRQNGPQGCLLSPKELLLSYVTSWSKFSFRISTKLQLPNLDQTSGSKSWLFFSHKISTKLQPQNVDQILASKSWPKIYFEILTRLQLQYHGQNNGSKSEL